MNMTTGMEVLREDLREFTLPARMQEKLRGRTMIVTGATGLVGASVVRCLHALGIGMRFLLPVRNPEKAIKMLEGQMKACDVISIERGLTEWFDDLKGHADYIVHCAAPTDGRYMTEHPVETFTLPIESTRAMLEYAMRADRSGERVNGMVFVSSMEYYGRILDDEPVDESRQGYVERQSPRSSYALGKQAAEYMCYCYAAQYGLPARSARLTQTFGAGIPETDNRVFAQFARSAIAGDDIVLHTEGRSAKPYCYVTDCVSALIYILLEGKAGESYNVATPGTYVSIRELAEIFREEVDPDIKVVTQMQAHSTYAPETRVNLDASRLLSLGWRPRNDLRAMIRRLVAYLR